LRGFLGEVVPDLAENFGFEKMRPARREYFLGNWRSRKADLLIEIPYRLPGREDWALVCVLLAGWTDRINPSRRPSRVRRMQSACSARNAPPRGDL